MCFAMRLGEVFGKILSFRKVNHEEAFDVPAPSIRNRTDIEQQTQRHTAEFVARFIQSLPLNGVLIGTNQKLNSLIGNFGWDLMFFDEHLNISVLLLFQLFLSFNRGKSQLQCLGRCLTVFAAAFSIEINRIGMQTKNRRRLLNWGNAVSEILCRDGFEIELVIRCKFPEDFQIDFFRLLLGSS